QDLTSNDSSTLIAELPGDNLARQPAAATIPIATSTSSCATATIFPTATYNNVRQHDVAHHTEHNEHVATCHQTIDGGKDDNRRGVQLQQFNGPSAAALLPQQPVLHESVLG